MATKSDNAANSQEPAAAVDGPRATLETAAHSPAPPAAPKSRWMAVAARGVVGGCLKLTAANAVPLTIVGAWLVFRYVRHEKKKKEDEKTKNNKEERAKSRNDLRRSISMGALYGGKEVIERMIAALDVERNREAAARDARAKTIELLVQSPINFADLKRNAIKLEMSGTEDEAIKLLEDARKQVTAQGRLHEAHELQMLLLEMRIYKGDYKKVSEFEFDKDATDARVPLYKAMAYSLLGNSLEAKKWYDEFEEIRTTFYTRKTFNENSKFYNVAGNFHDFESLVSQLKEDIEDRLKNKGKNGDPK